MRPLIITLIVLLLAVLVLAGPLLESLLDRVMFRQGHTGRRRIIRRAGR